MTTPLLVTVTLKSVTGQLEDASDLDWAFLAEDTESGTIDGIQSSIEDFFNSDAGAQNNALAQYLSSSRSRSSNGVLVDYYDLTGHLDGSPHGSPVASRAFTLAAMDGDPGDYPDEVAVRMSLKADGWEDVPETAPNPDYPPTPPKFFMPRARYRGGFFFGPVNDRTTDGVAPLRPVNGFFEADVSYAWDRFMDERGGDFGVWSRADATIRLVAPDGEIVMDDAYDTIRKRGPAATVRTVRWP